MQNLFIERGSTAAATTTAAVHLPTLPPPSSEFCYHLKVGKKGEDRNCRPYLCFPEARSFIFWFPASASKQEAKTKPAAGPIAPEQFQTHPLFKHQ
mmetsp:Transcript_5956/g.10422  ORF Transcript_5956/g.10422 Transcript_5956/m.10422 type:complete len:96 (-) Transcript_5956:363-650(-)